MTLVKVVSQFDPPQYSCIKMNISGVGSIYNLGGQIFNWSPDLWFQTQTFNQLSNGNLNFYVKILFNKPFFSDFSELKNYLKMHLRARLSHLNNDWLGSFIKKPLVLWSSVSTNDTPSFHEFSWKLVELQFQQNNLTNTLIWRIFVKKIQNSLFDFFN